MSKNGPRGGNALLLRFMESPHFTLFMCVSYLERYSDNVGIHFELCRKLRSFPIDDIEFFLPQLVQLHVTVETDSLALEDLLLDLCATSTHCALLVFWQLQAHLTELAGEPESYAFQVCKRLYNKLQYVLFSTGEPPSENIRENTFPALVLAGSIAGAIGVPSLGPFIKPLVVSQGRKQRSHIFHLASKLLRSKLNIQSQEGGAVSSPDLNRDRDTDHEVGRNQPDDGVGETDMSLPATGGAEGRSRSRDVSGGQLQRVRSVDGALFRRLEESGSFELATSAQPSRRQSPAPSVSSLASASSFTKLSAVEAQLAAMTDDQKASALKTNYFRCETQFVYALQAISARLLQVPKQARLSALRAELAMLNRDLPAEIDIPLLLPTNTSGPKAAQNRIVRISPAEAAVLNSAERVPFLLLIEYLKDDVNFDPTTDANRELLTHDKDRRYIFDVQYWHDQSLRGGRTSDLENPSATGPEGDLAAGDLAAMGPPPSNIMTRPTTPTATISVTRPSMAVINADLGSVSSPRASELSFASSYSPGPSTPTVPTTPGGGSAGGIVNYGDVTDIATHMRTAAIMLSQLEADSSKLPKDQVAAIKARIIASMQAMEEHTAYANGRIVSGEAGERKLENDLKTAGMSNLDDPSAKNLGEDWRARKERIRKSSPYGHLPNWDLFSVIAKTGSDLRQEAFACQLIQAMKYVWDGAGVDVWVKNMRILITNDSSGLVETITNGLSIHSIKKSLTNATIASGNNPKGTIASLGDHFDKTFGSDRESEVHAMSLDGFVRSLAAYSIICYILQIKDRHNGNILLDNEGHIIHIDFGFLLSNSPGRFGFEAAPFKLTQEYIDLMGGIDSPLFEQFRCLLKQAFKAIRKEAESIIILVEMMSRDSDLPCFSSGPATALQLRQRFQLQLSETEADAFVDNVLIQKSAGSMYTRLYDQYQLLTQGIYS